MTSPESARGTPASPDIDGDAGVPHTPWTPLGPASAISGRPGAVMPAVEEAAQRSQEILKNWREGQEPDALAALEAHPEIGAIRDLALDLAYEEYCLRCEDGEPLDIPTFCGKFPELRSSLQKLIDAHGCFEDFPELLEEGAPTQWGPGEAFPVPGVTLGRYTLVRELGQGSFARVYLATDANTGNRPVALKLSRRTDHEARILGPLNHPHIVPVLDAGREPITGLNLVCMPYLGCATLRDLLEQVYPHRRHKVESRESRVQSQKDAGSFQFSTLDARRSTLRAATILEVARSRNVPDDPEVKQLPPPAPWLDRGSFVEGLLHLGAQLSGALAALHHERICHRDLKPTNVLLSLDGRALLLDFNLSAEIDRSPERMAGTLPYMPPEQVRAFLLGHAGGRDLARDGSLPLAQGDLFALGVLLYELLSGIHPFGTDLDDYRGEEQALLLLKRQQEGHCPLRALVPEINPAIAKLIDSCLAFDPQLRPERAEEISEAFRRFLEVHSRRRSWFSLSFWGPGMCAALLAVLLLTSWGRTAFLSFPPGREMRRARGWARLRQSYRDGDPLLRHTRVAGALTDFAHTGRAKMDGPTLAVQGYCHTLLGEHEPALYCYNQALKQGYRDAALLNNRAYSTLRSGPDLKKLKRARQDLDEALRLNDKLQAAYYNRALLVEKQHKGKGLPAEALADIEKAIQMGEGQAVKAELFADAARLYARSASSSEGEQAGHLDQAILYLGRAIELGLDLKSFFVPPPGLEMLRSHPGWRELQLKPRGSHTPGPDLHLAEPGRQP